MSIGDPFRLLSIGCVAATLGGVRSAALIQISFGWPRRAATVADGEALIDARQQALEASASRLPVSIQLESANEGPVGRRR
jgi:hypothetical protein